MPASQPSSVPRSTARRALALMLSCVLVLATLFAGRTYSWCLLTQRVCTAACLEDGCDDTHDGEDGPGLHEPCCETRAMGALPPGTHLDRLQAVPDAKVAVLPDAPPLVPATPRLNRRVASTTRAILNTAPPRAGPIGSAQRCAVLQVFRC